MEFVFFILFLAGREKEILVWDTKVSLNIGVYAQRRRGGTSKFRMQYGYCLRVPT